MAEIRFDPIDRQTVVIAPERSKRPKDDFDSSKQNSKKCPFCPGNEDQTPPENFNNGDNIKNWTIRSFPNKYPAFTQLENGNNSGIQDVIVESDKHDINMGDFSQKHLRELLTVYKKRFESIKAKKSIKYILLFKNHGLMAGATLEHPHSQMVGLSFIPRNVEKRIAELRKYYNQNKQCYYCRLVDKTEKIFENKYFALIAPPVARFSYETWILPKNHQQHFELSGDEQLSDLAEILLKQIKALNMAQDKPAFNILLNNGLYDSNHDDVFHWNIQIIPRVSFQAGFEYATGMYINQVEPDRAVQELKRNTLLV